MRVNEKERKKIKQMKQLRERKRILKIGRILTQKVTHIGTN